MSFKAKLFIDELEINILNFSFSYTRQADILGRPTTKPKFEGITLVIEARKDLNLADWATARNQIKQLELHIYPRILGTKTRKIKLYDCHLLKWENHFNIIGTEPMTETLKVSCGGVKDSNSGMEYSTYWRETFDEEIENEQLVREEKPQVLSCNYTDLEGTPIEELYEGDVILEVKTKNCVGKTIDIDLSDDEFDFNYKGNYVEDDLLQGIQVTADFMKIELEAFEE